MLINETCKITNLTKKAIEYYTEQGLIHTKTLVNSYRDFSDKDIDRLKKIYVLRKLGLTVEEVKMVLEGEADNILHKISVKMKLKAESELKKQVILDKLCNGESYSRVREELETISLNDVIIDRILEAFPGYYGRFICLHFARFLNEPISSKEQQDAYQEIVEFLDNIPSIDFPQDILEYFLESTKDISTSDISRLIEGTKKSIEEPERFFNDNKAIVEQYLIFKQSEEYVNSPLYQLQSLLQEFNKNSGYYDIFIPAMKRLSTAYEQYYRNLEIANEKFLSLYPEL